MAYMTAEQSRNAGLLILRVGIGAAFIVHGYPKVVGGPEVWTKLGHALSALGINFMPTAMGCAAALSEFIGGILLIFGLFTRTAAFFMFTTMVVATAMHLSKGDDFKVYSHALEAAILFLSLTFIGGGKYALEERVPNWKK